MGERFRRPPASSGKPDAGRMPAVRGPPLLRPGAPALPRLIGQITCFSTRHSPLSTHDSFRIHRTRRNPEMPCSMGDFFPRLFTVCTRQHDLTLGGEHRFDQLMAPFLVQIAEDVVEEEEGGGSVPLGREVENRQLDRDHCRALLAL